MIEELEEEVTEMRALTVRAGGQNIRALENEKAKLTADIKELEARYKTAQEEISKFSINNPSLYKAF